MKLGRAALSAKILVSVRYTITSGWGKGFVRGVQFGRGRGDRLVEAVGELLKS